MPPRLGPCWRGDWVKCCRALSAVAVLATARGEAENGAAGQLPPWPGGERSPQIDPAGRR